MLLLSELRDASDDAVGHNIIPVHGVPLEFLDFFINLRVRRGLRNKPYPDMVELQGSWRQKPLLVSSCSSHLQLSASLLERIDILQLENYL